MMDLHEEAERLAGSCDLAATKIQSNGDFSGASSVLRSASAAIRELSARLAEVERERDAARADLSDALQRSCDNLERAVAAEDELDEARARVAAALLAAEHVAEILQSAMIEHDTADYGPDEENPWVMQEWFTEEDRAALADFRALARPEETDALDRIRREERERCAKVADGYDCRGYDDDSDRIARAIAAAIRGDKT